MSDYIFSTRPSCRTVVYELFHNIDILSGDMFRDSQIFSDSFRHSKLIQLKNRIWCDNCTSWEIHSLSHKVSSDTTLLSFKSGTDIFDRSSSSMLLLWLVSDVVIHQCGNKQLEILENFILWRLSITMLHVICKQVISSYDFMISICEIIFTSLSITSLNWGSDWWWTDW